MLANIQGTYYLIGTIYLLISSLALIYVLFIELPEHIKEKKILKPLGKGHLSHINNVLFNRDPKKITNEDRQTLNTNEKNTMVWNVIEKNMFLGPEEIDLLDELEDDTIQAIKLRLSNFDCSSNQFKILVRILCKNVKLPSLPRTSS